MSAKPQIGHGWHLMNTSSRDLSRVLFEARERISMQIDVTESQTGRADDWGQRLLLEIDAIRAREEWNPHGFGGEA
jgi:hypothetical protein